MSTTAATTEKPKPDDSLQTSDKLRAAAGAIKIPKRYAIYVGDTPSIGSAYFDEKPPLSPREQIEKAAFDAIQKIWRNGLWNEYVSKDPIFGRTYCEYTYIDDLWVLLTYAKRQTAKPSRAIIDFVDKFEGELMPAFELRCKRKLYTAKSEILDKQFEQKMRDKIDNRFHASIVDGKEHYLEPLIEGPQKLEPRPEDWPEDFIPKYNPQADLARRLAIQTLQRIAKEQNEAEDVAWAKAGEETKDFAAKVLLSKTPPSKINTVKRG